MCQISSSPSWALAGGRLVISPTLVTLVSQTLLLLLSSVLLFTQSNLASLLLLPPSVPPQVCSLFWRTSIFPLCFSSVLSLVSSFLLVLSVAFLSRVLSSFPLTSAALFLLALSPCLTSLIQSFLSFCLTLPSSIVIFLSPSPPTVSSHVFPSEK